MKIQQSTLSRARVHAQNTSYKCLMVFSLSVYNPLLLSIKSSIHPLNVYVFCSMLFNQFHRHKNPSQNVKFYYVAV